MSQQKQVDLRPQLQIVANCYMKINIAYWWSPELWPQLCLLLLENTSNLVLIAFNTFCIYIHKCWIYLTFIILPYLPLLEPFTEKLCIWNSEFIFHQEYKFDTEKVLLSNTAHDSKIKCTYKVCKLQRDHSIVCYKFLRYWKPGL